MSTLQHVHEFIITQEARKRYNFTDSLYVLPQQPLSSIIRASRKLTEAINTQKQAQTTGVSSGQLLSAIAISAAAHYLMELHQQENSLLQRFKATTQKLGLSHLEHVTQSFTQECQNTITQNNTQEEGRILSKLFILWWMNNNPAYAHIRPFISNASILTQARCQTVMKALCNTAAQSLLPETSTKTLWDMLQSPINEQPNSLHMQAAYIVKHWTFLPRNIYEALLRAHDIVSEETMQRSHKAQQAVVPQYTDTQSKIQFSTDTQWMQTAIMLVKHTYVWLDQLSKEYQKDIYTLDAIPHEELTKIAKQGFTVLWLIGLWKRSTASQRIKHLCGNKKAAASPYAIFEYEIEPSLGGHNALNTLKGRLKEQGIRIAGDIVPNHVGIDSKWIHEHPDWFISVNEPPFHNYTFNGENLSSLQGLDIRLEDHYYDKSDAAVVFRYQNTQTNTTQYIYHGNDGTTMPWNDTAQLNYLKADVRKAVIQTIIQIARSFPVIRFDAAMTLTKKHIQRLWFPAPGKGGAIPSRAEHAIQEKAFHEALPQEFWREVVQHVAKEAPDTLLIAEAFWMLESFFVRDLGMHRVYNSAFMHMLKNEENATYRQLIKDTLAFDKQILSRFVNFMNNPDEETAVEQFGNGDKYFGVCTLMVTMPGLPMFGHGQIEGFTEKYGMEFNRAQRKEEPDKTLHQRHQQEIFPLLRLRHLFACIEHFYFFDARSTTGDVLHNVYAYSNQYEDNYSLVIYNHHSSPVKGYIHTSCPVKHNKTLISKKLAAALSLSESKKEYVILQEQQSNLWYVHASTEIYAHGLFFTLNPYHSKVFTKIFSIIDKNGLCTQLANKQDGHTYETIKPILMQK